MSVVPTSPPIKSTNNDLLSSEPTIKSPSLLDPVNSSCPFDQLSADKSSVNSSSSTGFIHPSDSSDLSYNYPRHCYLTAAAKVNNIPGIVLLDTGSGVTIISSNHWRIIGTNSPITSYDGPEIQGPEGSSIGPEGRVFVQITLAGITIRHPAVLAKNFDHLILLGNDYMKSIGLVLDLQDNKMWLRTDPDRQYSISSDLTQAGRIDVPVMSTEHRVIAPYHIAYIQVSTPTFLSSNTWDASITGHRPHIATANSLIRFTDRKSFVQIVNYSARQQNLYAGQHVAVADAYFDYMNHEIKNHSSLESPMPYTKEGSYLSSLSNNQHKINLENHLQDKSGSLTFALSSKNVMCADSNCCSFSSSSSSSQSLSIARENEPPVSKISPPTSLTSHHSNSFISSSIPPTTSSITSQTSFLNVLSTSPSYSQYDLISSLSQSHISPSSTLSSSSSVSSSTFPFRSPSSHLQTLPEFTINDTDLDSQQVFQLRNLLLKYSTCFNDKTGRTSLTRHYIDTGNSKPIKLRPYRVSPARQSIISNQIQQMLHDGIIEPANGPYAAPVTLQPKKDGSLRFCVDFRQLNSATVRDVYPIPRIDDTLDQLQNAKYFTSMDLKSGFWQIELDDESRPKTAFTTHAGLYHFTVMPFGLTNAPATFQRLMDLVLGGLKWSCALVYLDDIIVYSSTFSSHLQHLELVLQRIQASGLTLHRSKCQFCKTKLRYLGHVVSQSGIEPDPDKIRAVREYPIPMKLKDVRAFLGLTSYYRRFIKNFATVAEPLISLTRSADNRPFLWSTTCQQAFDYLRQLLIQAPIVAYPQFDKPFVLQLDASDVGLSAILAQKLIDEDGVQREHVIGYASRTLSSSERHFSATERECLAIVYGCNHFRPYLEGVRFTIVTDHKALKWLHHTKDLNSRLARWAMQIAAYDVEIQHRPGSDNANCDALSRAPVNVVSNNTITSSYTDPCTSPTIIDPGYLFVLDYFSHGSLPSPQRFIPISLQNNVTITTTPIFSSPSLPFTSLANIHFGDNIQLYDDIRVAQWQDSELLPLLNYLQAQQLPDDAIRKTILQLATFHRVIDGVLYRVVHSSKLNTENPSSATTTSSEPIFNHHQQFRLVIPKSKIIDLLSLAHDHPTSAHLGRRKTLFRLSTRFYWPHMRRDVEEYVRACKLCQQYKASNQKPGGLMSPIVVNEPWNTVGIDLTGPLPKTRRGNIYILVVIDYFTKWVELFPLTNIKAKTIAQIFVDDVMCRFGFPVRIISDNGVQFLSNIFTNVCQILDIKHQRTPFYHPQSNLCERVNRTIKPLLAALAHHDSKSWDTKLAQIAFALRTARSDSTEQSPAFLMFGRHPRNGLDLCLPSPTPVDQLPTTDDLSDYRKRLLTDLLPAYTATREILDISHQRQASQYNQHHRFIQFEPGDLVWVAALSGIAMGKWRGKKLSPRREGPYRVVERLSSLTYSLIHTITNQQLGPIHVNRLERYYSFKAID
ncbi:unnamed protein product [Rotaria socialis]|uniref:RNA-directed DNA polymerase n=3 Tax=Rotaria TaxID=231623 RepID=A0A821E107_9BILA|nr:unnamed protein product [Rotaria socialis]CAF4628250.1 unnamed protein product [Rotaria socialis]